MKNKQKDKDIPIFKTDKEAEDFVENADLSEYDLSDFKPMNFEFKEKSARVTMRISESLLIEIKRIAREAGLPYTRYIRRLLQEHVARDRR